MKTFSLGFFYLIGMAWVLVECCLQASAGNPVPVLLYTLAFCVVFTILGCLNNVSDKTINLTGLVMAAVMGLVLLGFSFQSWHMSGWMVGLPKVIGALLFALGSLTSILSDKSDEKAAEH